MNKKWWHDKVAYQIYPKSFKDTNDDGIGDIRGIIDKLDYLKELGIDLIWLSPIYCSPLADQGYDISDYYKIDPRFGTMEEMDELIAETKKREMKLIMDLVVNHCSDEHEWFQKALKDPKGEYGDYFYIQEGKGGKSPNNLRSYFGGSAWERIEDSDLYYLHLFHKKQPDLNWENPVLRDKIYEMINWWLEKGIAGFRIDAIINIKKVIPFHDYEPDRDDGLTSSEKMVDEAEGVLELLNEMKEATFQKHDAFTVGEVFREKKEDLEAFIGERGCFSSMFDFNETVFGISEKGWYDYQQVTPDDYRDCCFASQLRSDGIGFLSNIIENHDEPRGVSHYIPKGECSDKSKKMLATVYFMLKGLPFIYQGQEIGMENVPFSSIDEINDISTLDQYKVALNQGFSEEEAFSIVCRYSRDNARVPFQWDDGANAGFTQAIPWLKVNPNYKELNLKQQMEEEDSVFHYYKKLIALRKGEAHRETLVYGDFEPVYTELKRVMAYYRVGEDEKILIIGNFKTQPQELMLEEEDYEVLLNNEQELASVGRKILLNGYQAVILRFKR
ncbi:glycoside hydrolase family 13 protein [Lacrimispora algidixylanolytica]|uniref:Glucohydrolase n=1 Tax=Lacrimispora algidixylanolytica TaxID=94868 RepID=A0A419T0A8_9FIRM|nr:alpha-glucosidase [Lacrimispora algidixylanolytica]RKD30883.1 glucohydrolase [Lacrimispora algidixylanolytica]